MLSSVPWSVLCEKAHILSVPLDQECYQGEALTGLTWG